MLTKYDRKILKEIQCNFPINEKPWACVAAKLGLCEETLIGRVKALKARGMIRYIGAILSRERIGLKSTLIAMKVPKEKIYETARIINRYPCVTHNYLRYGEFNIWFTLCARSGRELSRTLNDIKMSTGIQKALDLRSRKTFKINAAFKV